MRLYSAPRASLFLACEDAVPVGVIGVRAERDELVIAHIGVAPARRRRGLGSYMVRQVATRLRPAAISAETDAEAVGFYRAYGFEIQTLGERYPGVIRYRCHLRVRVTSLGQ
jgi:ribosomal protein S18 acetylase RimI-like enzyme